MITGAITFNGLTDDDIVTLLEIKKRHPELGFIPTNLQAMPGPSGPSQPVYNNATFHWKDEGSLALVKEVLGHLTGAS
jgi:hypothetical protein